MLSEKEKLRKQKYYLEHKEDFKKRHKKSHQALINWYKSIKQESFCLFCGKSAKEYPNAFIYHHINPYDKEYEISFMVRRRYSRERILKEINKCAFLCTNCHRIMHWEEGIRNNQNHSRHRIEAMIIKSKFPCAICGEKIHPAALDFHHTDPSSKVEEVGTMISEFFHSDDIMKEIDKCEIVCANCHKSYHDAGDTEEINTSYTYSISEG